MIERNGWEMLIIPAIATEAKTYRIGPAPNQTYRRRKDEVLLPDREPKAVLDEMRRAIGSMNFAAQYQQDPIPAEGMPSRDCGSSSTTRNPRRSTSRFLHLISPPQ